MQKYNSTYAATQHENNLKACSCDKMYVHARHSCTVYRNIKERAREKYRSPSWW